MSDLDKNYARHKLELLLRDLSNYNAGEFWREMSRIASGATGQDHAEQLQGQLAELSSSNNRAVSRAIRAEKERDALASYVERLQHHLKTLTKWNNHLDPSERADAIKDLNQSPATSLVERDSDVARKAFLTGANWWAQCELDESFHLDENEAANEYAERIKAGDS